MIVTRRDLEESLARVRALSPDPVAGIHGPGSEAWRLQRDSLLFLGGGRAALLQLAHPFVAHAVDQHSKTRDDVVGRFRRTFTNVFAMSFGTLDDAFAAARRVHNIHTHITGTIPDDVGDWKAGTPYHANDVDSLRWVYATLVHTTVFVRERVLGPIAADVKERYYRDTWQFARLFGIPDALLPASWPAFDRYVAETISSGVLGVAPCARDMARFLFGAGVRGAPRNRLGRWLEVMTTALLPPRLRRDYGLAWGGAEKALAAASFVAIGAAARVVPERARELPASIDARRRVAGRPPSPVAAWMDRRFTRLAGMTAGQ